MKRRTAILALVLGAVAVAPAPAATQPSAERTLAERYAPVVRLVEQSEPCGHGEPYSPIDVDVLLANEDVALRGPWDRTNVVKVGPTAADLATGKYEYHLDFPGNALEPGCDYEKWSRQLTARPPTTYAHVVMQAGMPRKLAVQYWLFYVYNDFNNKHEGDWEMVQLVFEASSAREALTERPRSIGYSQHSGAESAGWGDDKLELVGTTHPVVHPAAGSHANYYEPALYLGRSAAEGVGCDDTSGRTRDVRPRVAFVPSGQAAYERAYPWLGYRGRWGEKQPSFYNGPTGPNNKRQWTNPISWAEATFRERSFAVPAGGVLGSDATDFFCGAVAAGSNLLTRMTQNPAPVVVAVIALVALALWGMSRTQWSPSAPRRIARRRAWGQIVTCAWRMYASRFRLFAMIGLLFIPVSVAITLLQALLFGAAPFERITSTEAESNSLSALLGIGLGVLLTVVALTIVQAATARAMVELDDERPISAWDAYRAPLVSAVPLLGALVVALAVVILLDLFVIGAFIALWLVVRWSLLAQVVAIEGMSGLGALRRSSALVSGHWLRAGSITLLVTSIGLLLGPLLGALLLLVSNAPFTLVNLVAGVVYAIVMPFVAVATTYLYYDLRVRAELAPQQVQEADVLPAEIAARRG